MYNYTLLLMETNICEAFVFIRCFHIYILIYTSQQDGNYFHSCMKKLKYGKWPTVSAQTGKCSQVFWLQIQSAFQYSLWASKEELPLNVKFKIGNNKVFLWV